jgi:hypothetical protein
MERKEKGIEKAGEEAEGTSGAPSAKPWQE